MVFFVACNWYVLGGKLNSQGNPSICLRFVSDNTFQFESRYNIASKAALPRIASITIGSVSEYYAIMINNYWMRYEVEHDIMNYQNRGLCQNHCLCQKIVICQSRRLRQITQTWGFDNSWYRAKTEFNNCFIIRFSHNSSLETEGKRSAILFLRRTLQGA